MWTGTIQITSSIKEEVEKICEHIHDKDSTFNYQIKDYALEIRHEDRTILYKKIIWLINKVKILEGSKFKVRKSV